jgi:hypothetical protein
MKVHLTTAALILSAAPVFSQTPMTGVSNPDPVVITSDDNAASPTLTPRTPTAKPAAGTPATAPATTEVYGPYVPYKGAISSGASNPVAPANDALPKGNVDGLIVTSVPDREGEISAGTILNTKISQDLSTASTVPGTRFTAEVMAPIEKNGRVIIPIGSILEGQVTQVHSGHRITGTASMHLETRNITLPDGTHYVVHAQLIDVVSKSPFKVDDEGTLKRKDHTKENIAVFSLATGGGAAAGAMIGGGVGAAVGAGIGAGVSTVMWLKQDRQATLSKDVRLVFSLTTPMVLTPLANGPVSSLTGESAAAVGAAQ